MKTILVLPLVFLLLGGCSATYEIPVVRPSTWDEAELRAAAVDLVSKYDNANLIAAKDRGKPVRTFTTHLTDEKWLDFIRWWTRTRDTRPMNDWNWDPGTTARVHIYWANMVGVDYWASIHFIKDGKVVGKSITGGGREQFGYYRDMRKLGIFIP